jgi:hypothetical protein
MPFETLDIWRGRIWILEVYAGLVLERSLVSGSISSIQVRWIHSRDPESMISDLPHPASFSCILIGASLPRLTFRSNCNSLKDQRYTHTLTPSTSTRHWNATGHDTPIPKFMIMMTSIPMSPHDRSIILYMLHLRSTGLSKYPRNE